MPGLFEGLLFQLVDCDSQVEEEHFWREGLPEGSLDNTDLGLIGIEHLNILSLITMLYIFFKITIFYLSYC